MSKCSDCDQPMLAQGQRRKDPDDYRHASGCPKASSAESKKTAALLIALASGFSGKGLDEMIEEAGAAQEEQE